VLQQAGTPAEIYNKPANMFVADFMGSPAMNLIPAEVVSDNGALNLEMKAWNGKSMQLHLGRSADIIKRSGRKSVIFGIRPEAITDPGGADRSSSTLATADCQIEVVEPAGADTYAVIHLGGEQAVARLRADAQVQRGQVSPLVFNLDKAVFFDPESQQRLG
jgi:multiple sugar transport system ATP-binding protein